MTEETKMKFNIELDSRDIEELFRHIQRVLAYQNAEFIDPTPVDYILMGILAQIHDDLQGRKVRP